MSYKSNQSDGSNLYELIKDSGDSPPVLDQATSFSNLVRALFNLKRLRDVNRADIDSNRSDIDDNTAFIEALFPRWDDIRVPVTSVQLGGAQDPDFIKFADNGAGSQGVFAYAFSNLIEEEVFFTIQIPHTWQEGSNIHAHVHWSPSTAAAGGVVWGLEYTWANVGSIFPNTVLAEAMGTASGTAKMHQATDIVELNGTGKKFSSMLQCRLYRKVSDPLDNYGADAFLHEIDFHFLKDKVGSTEEFPS